MTDREWAQLLARGRDLKYRQDSLQWEWGDLALEVEPITPSHAKTGAWERLRFFAQELNLNFETLRSYRSVASAWPEDTRVSSAPWKAHQILASHPRRAELISEVRSKADALRLTGQEDASSAHHPAPARARRVAELLADPDVAREVMAQPEVRMAVECASSMADEAAVQEVERRNPGLKQSRNRIEILDALTFLGRTKLSLLNHLSVLKEITLDQSDRSVLSERLAMVEDALAWLRSYIDSGDASFDDELAKLLADGGRQ